MSRLTMLLCVVLFTLSAHAGQINVNGEALVQVAPDEVQISLGIEIFNRDLDAGKRENDARAEAALKAIKALGVEEAHIQTDVLSVELKYKSSNQPSEGIEGYYIRRSYKVCLKDVKKFEAVIDAALKNGMNHIVDIEFKSTELRKYRDQARLMAIKAAKEKAEALTGALDAKLGKPTNISEGYYGYEGAYRNWWGRGGYGYGNGQNSYQNVQGGGGGGGEGGGTLPLGMIGIRAQVNVTFMME